MEAGFLPWAENPTWCVRPPGRDSPPLALRHQPGAAPSCHPSPPAQAEGARSARRHPPSCLARSPQAATASPAALRSPSPGPSPGAVPSPPCPAPHQACCRKPAPAPAGPAVCPAWSSPRKATPRLPPACQGRRGTQHSHPTCQPSRLEGSVFQGRAGSGGRPDPPPGPSPSTWTPHFSVGISPPPPPSSFLPCCRSGAPPCPRDLPLRVRGPHYLCSCHWGALPPACPPPGRRGRGWGLSSPPPPPPAVPPSLSGPVALGSRSPRVRSPTARGLQVEAGGAWFVGAGRTAAWTTRHRPLRG